MAPLERIKLKGNRVLLIRVESEVSSGGFELPDTYGRGRVIFKVLQAGTGEWVKRRKKRVWIEPEVAVGDFVVSHHWKEASSYPQWHQPEYLDFVDGRGRCIIDARFVQLKWNPKQNYENTREETAAPA